MYMYDKVKTNCRNLWNKENKTVEYLMLQQKVSPQIRNKNKQKTTFSLHVYIYDKELIFICIETNFFKITQTQATLDSTN